MAAKGPISRGLQRFCNDLDTIGTVACGKIGPVRQRGAETVGRIEPEGTPPMLPWPTGHAAGLTGRGQGAGRETTPRARNAPPSVTSGPGRRTWGRHKEGRSGKRWSAQVSSDRSNGAG